MMNTLVMPSIWWSLYPESDGADRKIRGSFQGSAKVGVNKGRVNPKGHHLFMQQALLQL